MRDPHRRATVVEVVESRSRTYAVSGATSSTVMDGRPEGRTRALALCLAGKPMRIQAAFATMHPCDTCNPKHPASGGAAADHCISTALDPAAARPYWYSYPYWPARACDAIKDSRFSFVFRGSAGAWASPPRNHPPSRTVRGRCRNRHRATFFLAAGRRRSRCVGPDVPAAGGTRDLRHAAADPAI